MPQTERKKTWIFLLVNSTLGGLMIGGMGLALLASSNGNADAAGFWRNVALTSFGVFLIYALPRLAQSLFQAGTAWVPLHIPWLGVIFGTLIAVVAGAAFVTGNNLFYLLLAVMASTLIVSMLANRLNLTRLGVNLTAPPHVFAAEPAQLDITLTNFRRLLPAFSLTLSLERQSERPTESEAQMLACYTIVPPRSRASQQVTHTFARRGVYALRQLALQTRFPFGLVERRLRLNHVGELIVYPPLKPLSEFATAPHWQAGWRESQQRGHDGDLYFIRPYQAADRRRAIDWKATAKAGQLMTRVLTREEDWQVTIAFDATSPSLNEEQFERGVNYTASLIDWLTSQGAAVRLLIGQPQKNDEAQTLSDYGAGRAHGLSLLAMLARVAMPPSSTTNEPAAIPDWMERLGGALQRTELVKEHAAVSVPYEWLSAMNDLRDGRSTLLLVTPVPRANLPVWLTTTAQVFCFAELGNA
jgi:uncharacterized protein (DUF58 family)